METKDRFDNLVPFKALPTKDAEGKPVSVPADEIGKAMTVSKTIEGVTLEMPLDYLYIQRGRGDEATSKKGWKYPGKRITEDNLDACIEFWSGKVIAGFLDTALNTRFQSFAEQAIEDKWTNDDLKFALANLTVRDGNSKASMQKQIVELGKNLGVPGTPEYMANLQKLGELAVKMAA